MAFNKMQGMAMELVADNMAAAGEKYKDEASKVREDDAFLWDMYNRLSAHHRGISELMRKVKTHQESHVV